MTDLVEIVSQIYAERFSIERDLNWFALKLTEELGELVQALLMLTGRSRVSMSRADMELAVRDELADVLAQTLLLANHLSVDLEAEISRKWLSYLPE